MSTPTKTSSPSVRAARARREDAELTPEGTTGRVVSDAKSPHGVRVDLNVPLREIPDTGVRVRETFPPAYLTALIGGEADSEDGWWIPEPGSIDLLLARENRDMLRLKGAGSFQVRHACVRCLNDVTFPVALDFDLRLIEGAIDLLPGESADYDPHGLAQLTEDSEAGALGWDDDEDFVTFQGDVIDLDRVVREQLLLELPMHPRCDSEGAISAGHCEFDPEGAAQREAERWVDPRWEGLMALKDKLKN